MWNNERYLDVKSSAGADLRTGYKSAYALMNEYKRSIENEDYEEAKALTEVLAKKGHDTLETHRDIRCLND